MKKTLLAGLACGALIFGIIGLAGATSISTLATDWSLYHGTGTISQTVDGVKLSSVNNDGAVMESNQTADFSNADVYIKWMAYGGSTYMGTGVGTGYFTGGYYTTHHSFEGSLVIPENTWLFTHIDYNPDMSYHTTTSTGNFDTSGGTLLHSTSFTVTDVNYWNANVKAGGITAGLIDNSYTHSPWVIVGEARYELEDGANAPVPEPATMLLMGTGLAGLIAARRKKKAS